MAFSLFGQTIDPSRWTGRIEDAFSNRSLPAGPPLTASGDVDPNYVVASGGEFGGQVTQGDITNAVNYLNTLDLSPEEYQIYLSQITNPQNSESLNAALSAASSASATRGSLTRAEDDRTRAEKTAALNVRNLEGSRDRALANFDRQINRYQGFLDNPSSIRGDAQLAKQLTEVEGAIDQQINTRRQTAAKGLSDAGLRASGKVTNSVQNAQLAGTAMKGQNFSNLLGNIQGQRDYLGTERGNFDLSAANAINAARSGGDAYLSGLTQAQSALSRSPDFGAGGLTNIDIQGLNFGKGNQDFANFLNFASLIGSMAQNSGQQLTSAFSPGGVFRGS